MKNTIELAAAHALLKDECSAGYKKLSQVQWKGEQ